MKPEDFDKIRSAHLFKGMSDDILRNIVGNEPPRDYAKGSVVFLQDEEAAHFYIILEGWVKLYRLMPSGDEAILHVFGERETFAEAAMFNGHKYPATAEVVSDARMLAVNCNHFTAQLQDNPQIALSMLASTTEHMKHLVTEIEQIKGRNSTQRLAYFLFKMCPPGEVSSVLFLPYEKSLIASRLGIQPESLSRTLNNLRAYGVNCVKNQVIISDVSRLRNLAQDSDI
jgi:CRP-like cAMP-binding protein